jgi:hypothetical protein
MVKYPKRPKNKIATLRTNTSCRQLMCLGASLSAAVIGTFGWAVLHETRFNHSDGGNIHAFVDGRGKYARASASSIGPAANAALEVLTIDARPGSVSGGEPTAPGAANNGHSAHASDGGSQTAGPAFKPGPAGQPAGQPGTLGSPFAAGGATLSDAAQVPAVPLSIPVLIQEALDPDDQGVDRMDSVATFGLPLPRGKVFEVYGRPELAVLGSMVWQFRSLDFWDDGSVRWALVDVSSDVAAGQIQSNLKVVAGPGASGGKNIARATPDGKAFVLNSGPLKATILREGFNLLYNVHVDEELMLGPTLGPSFYGLTTGGDILLPGPTTVVSIEENGPARAVVRADGPLVDSLGNEVIDFTCRITARDDSRDLEVTVTVRNASKNRPLHTQVEAIEIVCRTRTGNDRSVTLPRHTGIDFSMPLPPGTNIFTHQAQTDAATDGPGSTLWLPHIPYVDENDKKTLSEQGYRIVSNGNTIHPNGDVTEWPELGWINLSGSGGAVTVTIKNMPYLWPATLEASGRGLVTAGLWTARNSVPYTFVFQQHESRTVLFSFDSDNSADPLDAARRLDAPLTGRAADYGYYDDTKVFPYRLLTLDEHAEAYALMGIDHTVEVQHPALEVTRYLYKGTTGGSNNSPGIETGLAGEWLRHGFGGSFQRAIDLALWKSEWQIKRSDDFVEQDAPQVLNDALPHTEGHQGDDEHRYRGGMTLAYYLTGDERIKDALYDEAEVLATVSLWAHERSMYQTLRAMARVAEFTHDQSLTQLLRERMDFVSPQTLDIYTETSGYGWETDPNDGNRRYFAFSGQGQNEKPPGENFQARGFISASLGPVAFHMAARHLAAVDPTDPRIDAATGRLTDLAFWTYNELFPWFADPADRQIVYSYAITLQEVTVWEKYDFHPILTGMAQAYEYTGDSNYLQRGVQQIEAHQAHDNGPFDNNLHLLDSRLDAQHFFAVYREWALQQPST